MKFLYITLALLVFSSLCLSIDTAADGARYCLPAERGTHICPLYYMEMCAWYYKEYCTEITIGGTCAKSAGNSCFACADPKIEKTTVGPCPQ